MYVKRPAADAWLMVYLLQTAICGRQKRSYLALSQTKTAYPHSPQAGPQAAAACQPRVLMHPHSWPRALQTPRTQSWRPSCMAWMQCRLSQACPGGLSYLSVQ